MITWPVTGAGLQTLCVDAPWLVTGIESRASNGDERIRDGYYLNGTVREPWAIITSTGTLRESWTITTSTGTLRESGDDYYLRSNGERTIGDFNLNRNH